MKTIYEPQEGVQRDFCSSDADIAIYGGAAGSGKTYALLLDFTRFFLHDGINGVIFRRTQKQLTLPGTIWTESIKIYTNLGLTPNYSKMQYKYNKNSYLRFCGIQHEHDMHDYQGAQFHFVGFDELTQFTEKQFWYLFGRMRTSDSSITPYARCTCNPSQGWVKDLLTWWIDPQTGYPIKERAGQKKWLLRMDGQKYLFKDANIARLYRDHMGWDKTIEPVSLTFYPATINDNQKLIKNDPSYLSKLSQLPHLEKMALKEGCWLDFKKGKIFQQNWLRAYLVLPPEFETKIITCDTASTTKTSSDWTVFQVWGRHEGKIYLIDQARGKWTHEQQYSTLSNLIFNHKPDLVVIEAASSGHYLIENVPKKTGAVVKEITRTKDKYQRAYEIQPYVESGRVYLGIEKSYYNDLRAEICSFAPEEKDKQHDDQVDCFIDAVKLLLADKIGYTNRSKRLTPRYIDGQKTNQSGGQVHY